ncbi:Enamine/imine deaminase [Legionella santicrucis]|uniref:Enamine/imine deaminase n=1 Tax=Legionella santicrucis TaxID=45074 RepID=A0A0W0YRQ5_9GAMM|nr:Rid family hydrolase [Legionella santicrucis]KTD59576.1 Enamine/imine deaminase [Legionella santicrucis]
MDAKFELIQTLPKDIIEKNPQWNMPYVPAVKVNSGRPIYFSGVNAAPIYHSHPHQPAEFNALDFSVESQTHLTMSNLKTAVIAAGGQLNDIVQLIIFIVKVEQHGELIGKIVSDYFAGHICASTVVGIEQLFTDPRLILEITAVAYV